MARRYVRDAKGRFAPKGYSGQTGGRGARLKSGKGNIREVGGQKRGERHVLRSAETRAASKRSFDAAVKSGNVTLPKSLGGQGMPRNSFPAQAAARKKAQAQAERDAALRKSGLPKSGGAMRVKGGIKRDPKAGEKLKQLQQKLDKAPLAKEMSKAEFARKTGGKTRDDSMSAAIEMSRQPRGRTKAGDRRNEARLKKIQDDVRATDKAYDAAIKSGKIKAPTDSLARKAAGEASNPAVQAAKRLQAKIAAKRAAREEAKAPLPVSRQKEKWAAAAEKRRAQADRAEANAKRLRDANRRLGDTAFWTQPGLGKQRDKARAGLEKSFREQERAKALRSKANNLERMSKTTKGAAASRQQSRRDAFDARKIKKGDTVNSILYGQVKVLRVNKKTVTISVNGGKPFTEDKSRFSI